MVECVPQMKVLGKSFKKEAKIVSEHLSKLEVSEVEQLEQGLKDNGYVSIDKIYIYFYTE